MAERGLVKRSFTLAGHRTSVALEPEFWTAVEAVAAQRGVPVSRLVADIDAERSKGRVPDGPLASSLRLLALRSGS